MEEITRFPWLSIILVWTDMNQGFKKGKWDRLFNYCFIIQRTLVKENLFELQFYINCATWGKSPDLFESIFLIIKYKYLLPFYVSHGFSVNLKIDCIVTSILRIITLCERRLVLLPLW